MGKVNIILLAVYTIITFNLRSIMVGLMYQQKIVVTKMCIIYYRSVFVYYEIDRNIY